MLSCALRSLRIARRAAEACRVASSVGTVDWRAFAPAAADCLRGMLDAAEAERRDVAVATFAAASPLTTAALTAAITCKHGVRCPAGPECRSKTPVGW